MARRKTRTAVRELELPRGKPWEGSLRLVLPPPPSVNAWKVPLKIGGSVRVVKSREFRTYERAVQAAFAQQHRGVGPREGPLGVTVHWYRARRTGDLDGRLKSLCDALNALAWQDDAQIQEIHAFRHDDKANPRVEVDVFQLWEPPSEGRSAVDPEEG